MNDPLMITPEILAPRLGEQLVNMGLLTAEQLKQALMYQEQQVAAGKPAILLGQALLNLGLLDRSTLDRAITEQIIILRSALEDANRNLEARVQQRTAELEEALRKLSELSQLKANFLSAVSHELRTPLTHMRGYIELLDNEALGPITDEQKKALDVSLRSVHRLQNLIDDLIMFSQSSQGEMSLHLVPVDLNQVAGMVIGHIAGKAKERGVLVEHQIDPALLPVNADAEKIRWVITQLMDNAIKFTSSGGKVILKVVSEKGFAEIAVSDTGIGIQPERLAEVFEPFHQLDGSSTRRYGGTGLGLSLARQIVEAHGSLINIQSEVNKGTTVSFPLVFK